MTMWQWVAIFLLIVVIIFGIVYYVFFSNPSEFNYPISTSPAQINTPSISSISPSQITPVITTNNPAQGNILTDPKGMSLYIFDKDTVGVGNCSGSCASIWPPLLVTSASSTLTANLTIIKRTDGTSQYAWKGMPLYFYAQDKNVGDILGDGFNKIWHLARP